MSGTRKFGTANKMVFLSGSCYGDPSHFVHRLGGGAVCMDCGMMLRCKACGQFVRHSGRLFHISPVPITGYPTPTINDSVPCPGHRKWRVLMSRVGGQDVLSRWEMR